MNITEENYLRIIYELSNENKKEYVKISDIASKMKYTVQSVLEMVKKLADNFFVEYVPYKGVKLTENGKEKSIRLVRVHHIWEVFLSEYLKLDWSQVHMEAEKLQHVSSDIVTDKLYNFLGKPKFCCHGSPIPNEKGEVENFSNNSILKLKEGDKFKLKRVLDNIKLLNYLKDNGIKLYDKFEIVKVDNFNEIIILKDKIGKEIYMNFSNAKMLFY
ncbi:MAG: metal-dependent transcriptional regulator [Fusobacterium sp. JB021]|nr:metal-dependent transcriptional regulator [Fusobacterium sp. JB021]MDP0506435.1 metal-dependent transcriptional regulator [Fusobacterium sp. JB019]MDP0506608.1 metal-dependent transcriptional regulator [Fusobacterium sp. JB019]